MCAEEEQASESCVVASSMASALGAMSWRRERRRMRQAAAWRYSWSSVGLACRLPRLLPRMNEVLCSSTPSSCVRIACLWTRGVCSPSPARINSTCSKNPSSPSSSSITRLPTSAQCLLSPSTRCTARRRCAPRHAPPNTRVAISETSCTKSHDRTAAPACPLTRMDAARRLAWTIPATTSQWCCSCSMEWNAMRGVHINATRKARIHPVMWRGWSLSILANAMVIEVSMVSTHPQVSSFLRHCTRDVDRDRTLVRRHAHAMLSTTIGAKSTSIVLTWNCSCPPPHVDLEHACSALHVSPNAE
mmetsp:Transcript_7780/g.15429  ORF Transcript_7780/g.15429 Transcript_7780/m.15429 type:complete len:303 (+) Transcript_7780:605-1513(+)